MRTPSRVALQEVAKNHGEIRNAVKQCVNLVVLSSKKKSFFASIVQRVETSFLRASDCIRKTKFAPEAKDSGENYQINKMQYELTPRSMVAC
jgi:hypothetical protein